MPLDARLVSTPVFRCRCSCCIREPPRMRCSGARQKYKAVRRHFGSGHLGLPTVRHGSHLFALWQQSMHRAWGPVLSDFSYRSAEMMFVELRDSGMPQLCMCVDPSFVPPFASTRVLYVDTACSKARSTKRANKNTMEARRTGLAERSCKSSGEAQT